MHIASLPQDIIDEICFSKVQISVLNISTLHIYHKLCTSLFLNNFRKVILQLQYLSKMIGKLNYIESFPRGIFILSNPVKTLSTNTHNKGSYIKSKKLPLHYGVREI